MYRVAKALSEVINLVIGKSEHHLRNSKDLLEKIKGITLMKEEVWISHDVVGLFPSVPAQ